MHLHQNIRHLRKRSNLTQSQFGEQIGVKASQVTKYEKGTSEPPVSKLIVMADLFKVSLQDLVFTDLSKEEPKYDRPEVPYSEQEESKMIAELNDQLRKRVLVLEHRLKQLDPDLAKEWGIE